MEGWWLDWGLVVAVSGTVVGVVAAFFSLRRFVGWWRPIRIETATNLVLDGSARDQVIGTVTNVSA